MHKYRNLTISIISIAILSALFAGCKGERVSGQAGNAGEPDVTVWNELTKNNDFRELIRITVPVLLKAEEEGNDALAVAAGVYTGQAYLMLAESDSMYYWFNRVAPRMGDDGYPKYRMVMSNSLGIHNLMYAMNYNEALHYFYEALECCPADLERNRQVIKSNIVNVFYLREDPSGLDMAKDIYEWGLVNGDEFVTYRGALVTAYMYYTSGQYEQALDYVVRTTGLEPYHEGYANSDALHGTILSKLGRDSEAEMYFRRGIKKSEDVSTLIESYLSYGNYLLEKGRADEAVSIYLKGLELVEKYQMYFYGHRLYNSLSEAYMALGRDDIAVEYMKTYQHLVSDVFNVGQERSFSDLRLKYETARRENQIREKDMILMKQKQQMIVISLLSLLLAGVVTVVLVLYRRRVKMYGELVERFDLHMKREKMLSESFDDAPEENKSVPDNKVKDIFKRLEALMKDGLYKRSDLTMEMVADMLQTNRSYISKAVNTYASVSFISYVNAYRIRRAVEILSDPECDMPIKMVADETGYNNLTSFYKNFQKETGVPPSKYHQEIVRLREIKES